MLGIIGVILLIFSIIKFVNHKGGMVTITTITGLMLGALYNCDFWEEDNVKEYTLQFCLLLVTITVQWERKIGLKE